MLWNVLPLIDEKIGFLANRIQLIDIRSIKVGKPGITGCQRIRTTVLFFYAALESEFFDSEVFLVSDFFLSDFLPLAASLSFLAASLYPSLR